MGDRARCPVCGMTGGFHDNPDIDWCNDPSPEAIAEWEASPHKQARDRIAPELVRVSNTERRRRGRAERRVAHEAWKANL